MSTVKFKTGQEESRERRLFIFCVAAYTALCVALAVWLARPLAKELAENGLLGRHIGIYWYWGFMAVAGTLYGFKKSMGTISNILSDCGFAIAVSALVFGILFSGQAQETGEILWTLFRRGLPAAVIGSMCMAAAIAFSMSLDEFFGDPKEWE